MRSALSPTSFSCQKRSLREEPFKGVNAVRVSLSEPNKPNRAPIAKVISALRSGLPT
jgi:hypothetical protein